MGGMTAGNLGVCFSLFLKNRKEETEVTLIHNLYRQKGKETCMGGLVLSQPPKSP
jgi:hypothetical protein